jgi:hypothetical protein
LSKDSDYGLINQVQVCLRGSDIKIGHVKIGYEEEFTTFLLNGFPDISIDSVICISESSRSFLSSAIRGFLVEIKFTSLFSLSCEVEKFMIDTQSSSNNKRINQRVH